MPCPTACVRCRGPLSPHFVFVYPLSILHINIAQLYANYLKVRVGCFYYTVKKKGPRGVRFEGCYSPRSVMATHKGVKLTSWGVGRLR